MKIRKLVYKITGVLLSIVLAITLLLTTNMGLLACLTIASVFSPIDVTYGKVTGQIIGQPIQLHDLQVKNNETPLKVGKLTFNWQTRTLQATNVHGLEQYLPLAASLSYQEMHIDNLHAKIDFSNNKHLITLKLQAHSGKHNIIGNAQLLHTGDAWDIQHAIINFGNNKAYLIKTDHDYNWYIALPNPQNIFKDSNGAIQFFGSIENLQAIPKIAAKINAKKFSIGNYAINNLNGNLNLILDDKSEFNANINADSFYINDVMLKALDITLKGNTLDHTLTAKASYKDEPITILSQATFNNSIWSTKKLIISHKKERLDGNFQYLVAKKNGTASLNGSIFTMQTKAKLDFSEKNCALDFSIAHSPLNYLNGYINVANSQLDGQINAYAGDISFLMQWMPDVTRLKGNFSANITMRGALNKPDIQANAHIKNITATVPSLGIKIKPMEVHLASDKNGKFQIHGQGKMRRGPGEFNFYGSIEPFKKNMPNKFVIAANGVEFVNNQTAHLLASTTLKLHYAKEKNNIDVTGDITIEKGAITFPDNRTQTVKSKDVVFVNEQLTPSKNLIALNPNINLRINDGVHFNGFGLNADVTGKLNITQRTSLLYADGRITIKEGTYQLPGQKLLINHGRLLFPPGTLLVNPMLDIKMLEDNKGNNQPDRALELTVQGTAQKPVISESGLSSDKDRVISQAILTGSSVLSKNLIQDKLKISEIGLTSRGQDNVDFFDDPRNKNSLKNKDFVIGRSLGKRFYVQYLHSIGEANQRVRLKYSLNPTWAIGIESGTDGGGVDLSFAIERD